MGNFLVAGESYLDCIDCNSGGSAIWGAMLENESDWNVYMVRCRDGKLYTGITTDVERRFAEHQSGKGAKYLRGRAPLKLAFKIKIGKHSLALKIERLIKRLPRFKKERIVETGIDVDQVLKRRT